MVLVIPDWNDLNVLIVVLFSYALFDMDGHQVPQSLVTEVGEVFESLLEEVSVLFLPSISMLYKLGCWYEKAQR